MATWPPSAFLHLSILFYHPLDIVCLQALCALLFHSVDSGNCFISSFTRSSIIPSLVHSVGTSDSRLLWNSHNEKCILRNSPTDCHIRIPIRRCITSETDWTVGSVEQYFSCQSERTMEMASTAVWPLWRWSRKYLTKKRRPVAERIKPTNNNEMKRMKTEHCWWWTIRFNICKLSQNDATLLHSCQTSFYRLPEFTNDFYSGWSVVMWHFDAHIMIIMAPSIFL